MIILGIDPAIRCTGYGIINIQTWNDSPRFAGEAGVSTLDCGIIKNNASAPYSECLRRIAGGIRELVNKYHPDVASIEEPFFQKNVKTAMILSYARGAIMTVLAESGIPAYAYAPRKAKMAVCGSGKSSKIQVATMISSILGLKLDEIPLDSTDALALALCHGQLALRPNAELLLPKPL